MKVIKLADDDHALLKAAYAACEDAEKAMDQARENYYTHAMTAYSKVLGQLLHKHKLDGSASDDQQFLVGQTVKPADLATDNTGV